MNHNKKVYDTDPFFIVDAITRAIKNMSQSKVAIIQGDHNSERFTFQLPRFIEEHDMMEADKVEVHFINSGSGQSKDVYTVDDLSINDEDENTVKCSWLLSRATTAYSGKLAFKIRFVCFADDGVTIDYEWNTAPFTGISVGEGMDCSDAVTDEAYKDIIEQWKNELKPELKGWADDAVASQVDIVQIQKNAQNIESLTDEQNLLKSRVDNLAHLEEGSTTADAELLDIRVDHEGNTFPSAGDAVRDVSRKAAQNIAEVAEINARAIICKAEGKSPTVTDGAAETNIKGLKIYGRTDQIQTKGENLFDVFNAEFSSANNRASAEVFEDGTVRVSVIKTSDYINVSCNIIKISEIEGNTLHISAEVKGGNEGNQPAAVIKVINSETGASTNIGTSYKPVNGKINATITISDSVKSSYDTVGLLLYYNASASAGWTVGDYVDFSNIMISTTGAEYEPYTGLAPSPSPAYPQKMDNIANGGSVGVTFGGGDSDPQTATFSAPNGLPGIPVASGGNYTDENGQMWMADEIDLERGVYIQRIHKIDNTFIKYGQSNEENALFVVTGTAAHPDYLHQNKIVTNMCSHCQGMNNTNGGRATELNRGVHVSIYSGVDVAWYLVMPISVVGKTTESIQNYFAEQEAQGTPFEWFYVLAEPIETPLTEEEIAAYKALKTHKPVTTIINDADAYIEVDYVADTKNYIDNKFAELASAIINNA